MRLPDPKLRRDEEGQTAIEYVGAILVVGIILGVLIGAAPDLAQELLRGVRDQIDAILGS